jgi:MHS family proline/betaine transporter-like MFS transporter
MNSSQARRIIAAGMIGNVLEWYDFAIYGYFATAIGRHFFPHEDAVAQLLSAFGVFALGYLMRPVGAAWWSATSATGSGGARHSPSRSPPWRSRPS